MTEYGPIYNVELIDSLPISSTGMVQAMPSRVDLILARTVSERTVAGYEMLLATYQELAYSEAQYEKLAAQFDALTKRLVGDAVELDKARHAARWMWQRGDWTDYGDPTESWPWLAEDEK